MSDHVKARRCSSCDQNWPAIYKKCPLCARVTWIAHHETPLTPVMVRRVLDAHSIEARARQRRHEEFERYCEKRDEAQIAEFRHVLDEVTL